MSRPDSDRRRFPSQVRESMERTGAATTCVPVELDSGQWVCGIFFDLGGEQSKADRRQIRNTVSPFPVGIEIDLIQNDTAAVVVMRIEVHTGAVSPLTGEILLAPGSSTSHFEAIRLIIQNASATLFFGDGKYWVIYAQSINLGSEQLDAIDEVIRDANAHDAIVRMSGKYDAGAALAQIAQHYQPRRQ